MLRKPGAPARRLVYALRRLGYVEVVPNQRPGTWRNTMEGNALANATAAAPISRADAVRPLREFLIRVSVVNNDPSTLCRVGRSLSLADCLRPQHVIRTSIWRFTWTAVQSVRSIGPRRCWPAPRPRGERKAPFSQLLWIGWRGGNRRILQTCESDSFLLFS